MGNQGGSWTGLFAFWALAILMAVLGPVRAPESPVLDVVEAHAIPASVVADAEILVSSR